MMRGFSPSIAGVKVIESRGAETLRLIGKFSGLRLEALSGANDFRADVCPPEADPPAADVNIAGVSTEVFLVLSFGSRTLPATEPTKTAAPPL